MELVRIIEKDDKTARDKIKKIYGNDCLIVSSSRIKNKSELVIAIDLDNQVDNIFLQKNKKQSPFDLNKLTNTNAQDNNDNRYLNSSELFEKQKANQLASDIKEEILALREEFDRFKRNFSSDEKYLPENIADRLKNFDLPFTLYKMIEDEILETKNIKIASKNLEAIIKKNIHFSNIDYPLAKKIVFYGPSGSGKTTLLRTINGLENLSGGEIYFDNQKVNNNTILEVQKKTGMIFQEFNLVNNLSAINNVLTGLLNSSNKFLSLFYLFKKDQKIEALKSLKTVGLLEKSYNRSDELSGGQRQRVGIARAIIKRPLLLLADEPVASLDPKAANLILSLLKKINKEFGTTILCNLHQVDLAKKYSDRLVGLLDGKIIFDEKSENINKSNLEKIYV